MAGFLNQSQKIAIDQAQGGTNSKGFGEMVYTETHKQESGDLMLTFVEYEYKRADMGAVPTPNPTGTRIALPLPYNLETNYQTTWNIPEGGAWTEYLSNSGGEFIKNQISKGGDFSVFGSLVDAKLGDVWNEMKKGSSALGTDALSNNRPFQVAGQGAGIARNPFLAALFEGVQFRNFNMQWKLYPKSIDESNLIHKINQAIKYGMHPSYQQFGGLKNALFNYPYIYKPAFTKPEYLFEFGYCVIRNFTPIYHSEGSPQYFEYDGKKIPSFITISLEFQEIEIITKDTLAGPNGGVSGVYGNAGGSKGK